MKHKLKQKNLTKAARFQGPLTGHMAGHMTGQLTSLTYCNQIGDHHGEEVHGKAQDVE